MNARMNRYLNRNPSFDIPLLFIGLIAIAASFPGKAQQPTPVDGSSGIPTMFSYQGVIKIDDQPYSGIGYFKFAILSIPPEDGANAWANDGSESGEPAEALSLSVSNGLFNVNLGDSGMGMAPIPISVFSNGSRYLRVWFSNAANGPFEALEPNQRIVSVPYALNSAMLDGNNGDFFLNAANIYTGTLSEERYSAYADLQAEGKIGTSGGQLSVGDHNHYGGSWSGLYASHGLTVIDASGDTTHDALYGETSAHYGGGVHGIATSHTGNAYGVKGESQASSGRGVYGYAADGSGVNFGVLGETESSNGNGVVGLGPTKGVRGEAINPSDDTYGVYGSAASPSGAGVIANNSSPGTALAAYSWGGNILEGYSGEYNVDTPLLIFKIENDGDVYTDGAYHCGQSSGSEPGVCIIQNSPADFAEMFPAVEGLTPGDVLVISKDGKLHQSDQPYQHGVVGVYSSSPGYLGNGQNAGKEGYAPLAITGIVAVKASAENGVIEPGDLLVASRLPGHAMKAGAQVSVGVVIGKAMQGLDEATGVILMLVMLQ